MRRPNAAAGFTMMEMVISLGLVIFIIGFAAVSIDTVNDEGRLQHPASELKSFAKKAVKSAVAEQRSYSIFFYPRFFVLRETYPEVLEEEKRDDVKYSLFRDQQEEDEIPVVVSIRHDLGSDVGMEIRRWKSNEWVVPSEIEWVFEPSGLCEPISVRFTRRDGFIEIDFNPLTAGVQEERMAIP